MKRENASSADNQQGRAQVNLDPWYVSGFVDGEGSFHIAIYRDARMKTSWKVIPEFHVSQRETSKQVLYELVDFFACGYVKENHRTNPRDVTWVYVVRDRTDLTTKIMTFFSQYQLRTEKRNDFDKFAQIVSLMNQGAHLTNEGLAVIIDIAYTMNGGGRYRKRLRSDLRMQPSETICRT